MHKQRNLTCMHRSDMNINRLLRPIFLCAKAAMLPDLGSGVRLHVLLQSRYKGILLPALVANKLSSRTVTPLHVPLHVVVQFKHLLTIRILTFDISFHLLVLQHYVVLQMIFRFESFAAGVAEVDG